MRIALLQADWVNPEFIGVHGDLKDMIGRFVARHAPGPASVEVFRVLDGELPSDPADYDLLLVPGSRFSAYDDFPGRQGLVELLIEGRRRGSRILGLCFGAQLIAAAFGGEVERSEFGWNVGLKPVSVLPPAKWLRPAGDRVTALFNHRDRIVSLPADFEPILASPECPIAGFQHDGTIVGIQFHPEYTLEYQEALMSVSTTLAAHEREDGLRRNRGVRSDGGAFSERVLERLLGAA